MQGVGFPSALTSGGRLRARARAGRAAGAAKERRRRAIIDHPDVRRMLMTMRAYTEATRALGYVTAAALDNAHRHPDAEVRTRKRAFAELMIPIVKGWSTEIAQHVAYARRAGPRRHGLHRGNGRRAALRDARITTIYEGTTGIQANDLDRPQDRARRRARRWRPRSREMRQTRRALANAGDAETSRRSARACARGLDALDGRRRASSSMRYRQGPARACSPARCRSSSCAGIVCGGAQLATRGADRRSGTRRRRRRCGLPPREDRHGPPFRRSLPDPGDRRCATPSSADRPACWRSPTSSSEGIQDEPHSRRRY